MNRLRPRTLNQALAFMLAVIIVPLLLGALAVIVAQGLQEQELRQAQLAALAQTLAQAVDGEFDHVKAQLEVASDSSLIDERNWADFQIFGKKIAGKTPGSVLILFGPAGEQFVNTRLNGGAPLPNFWSLGDEGRTVLWEGHTLPLSSGSLTRQVFETNRVLYSDLYYGIVIKRPSLSLAIPVVRDGKVAYALLMAFPPALIEKLLNLAINVPRLRAAVTDRQGVVVASNSASGLHLGDKAIDVTSSKGSKKGFFDTVSPDGTRVQGAYSVSSANGFIVRVALPVSDASGLTSVVSKGWMLLALASLLACVGLVVILGRRLTLPLQALAKAALDGRPAEGQPTGIAEIDLLAQALRAWAEVEQKRRDELVVSTQRKQAEIELRKADRQKDVFLATLAHELRNPLAPIRTAAELIRLRSKSDPVVMRARDIIERQVVHLSRLVDDLLEVSRMTLGTIQLNPGPVDLVALASHAADSVRPTLEAAGIEFVVDFPGSPVTVIGDSTRLEQCIMNLLSNALKFTKPAGSITLRVATDGQLAVVEVTDSGVGISSDNLERIFDLFMQENPSGSDGQTGLGIGLALTRKLIESHGGIVRAASPGRGQGSTFRIELPASSKPHRAELNEVEPQFIGGAGARVLVVDDNRDAADLLGEALSLSGFVTSVEYTGESAVRAVEAVAPDAVLLDIGLPDINGFKVCRRIRSMSIRQPVIIALTGWGRDENRKDAAEAGFDAHITKPAGPELVISVLNEHLSARQRSEQLKP